MLSIASAEPHPDLPGALKKIKKGGNKAAGMKTVCSIRKSYLLSSMLQRGLRIKLKAQSLHFLLSINPAVSFLSRSGRPPHLQQTGMSKHTGMSTVTAWVSLYWEGSCEDFTMTRISPLAWRFLIHSGSTTVTIYLLMLTVRNGPSIDDVSTSYTGYRIPTQLILSEIYATPGWRSTGCGY
jgi:hypothetical protein